MRLRDRRATKPFPHLPARLGWTDHLPQVDNIPTLSLPASANISIFIDNVSNPG
jgi:hypothetical protein